jgi:hypothetical protein
MKRFIAEADRGQITLLPESLDDYIDEANPVRARWSHGRREPMAVAILDRTWQSQPSCAGAKDVYRCPTGESSPIAIATSRTASRSGAIGPMLAAAAC